MQFYSQLSTRIAPLTAGFFVFLLYFPDYFCSVKLIDESRTGPGIAVTFFAETMEKLPRIESIGDIIILTRVTVMIVYL